MTDTQQFILNLIDYTKTAKPFEFRFITTWEEFKYYRKKAMTYKLMVKVLQQSANNLFKTYCKAVIAGISDVNKLLAYKQLLSTISFYETERKVVNDMLDEYDEYLGNGNFWCSFLGGRRVL